MSATAPQPGGPAVAERYRLDGGALVAGRCPACGQVAWPLAIRCPTCGANEVAGEPVPRHGVVETWTRVWVPVPGVDSPYCIGRVRLGDCQVYGRIAVADGTELHTGAAVALRVGDGDGDGTVPPYWFEAGGQ